jgi:4-azaleucine resistance transporter AzlC
LKFNIKAFGQGALDTLPMVLAAIPFGILFGVLGPANDVSFWITLALSALVFAGSAQYVAIGLIASGTPAVLVVLTTFIVNLRHLLYALAMLVPLKHLKRSTKVRMSFFLTDETFVTFNQRYQQHLAEEDRHAYYFGSALFMYGNWQLCTWIGLWAGTSLSGIDQLGLEFAMVTAFLSMLIPMFKHKKNIVSALVGFILAWFTRDWPHKTGIVFSVVVAAFIASQLKFLEGER